MLGSSPSDTNQTVNTENLTTKNEPQTAGHLAHLIKTPQNSTATSNTKPTVNLRIDSHGNSGMYAAFFIIDASE